MQTKQVIVLRKDLNMRKGKMVAQGAHASMKVFFDRIASGGCGPASGPHITIDLTKDMNAWVYGQFTKICVSVNSESELEAIYERAKNAGIPCSLIVDSGRTEFGGVPTKTAVAVGPANVEDVDAITGNLSLL